MGQVNDQRGNVSGPAAQQITLNICQSYNRIDIRFKHFGALERIAGGQRGIGFAKSPSLFAHDHFGETLSTILGPTPCSMKSFELKTCKI